MISYLIGNVTYIDDSSIVLECGHIGFKISMPQSSLFRLMPDMHEVKVHTYMAVKEDDISLFGFLTMEELKMFESLLTVSGIGPKGAMSILSSISVEQLKSAIVFEDAKLIAGSKGIGTKTAQKIVIELKGKYSKEALLESENAASAVRVNSDSAVVSEALNALESLGFNRSSIMAAFNTINVTDKMTVSELVGEALKIID